MRCVDHTSSFTAYSGAPKQDMYRDPLHPSAKGTGRLACNIKYADRPRQRPALLKSSGPMQPGQFQNRQQGANAWQSVPGRLPSMTTPPSQQRGYTNVQWQPCCLMASSCPPHHHLPTDNRYHTIHTVSLLVGMWTPSHPTMSLNPAWMVQNSVHIPPHLRLPAPTHAYMYAAETFV